MGPAFQGKLERQIFRKYCIPPYCLQYQNKKPIQSQIGIHTKSGILTSGKTGYLIYGPYQPMNAGEYILKVTGQLTSRGDKLAVDVIWHKAGKTYARFTNFNHSKSLPNDVLLEEKVTLDEDVDALEIRIFVDNKTVLAVYGYRLTPISKLKISGE
jgi:hypothetical protein